LNIGMHLPISTGTDWFIYDFSRVYARVEGQLTVKSWLAGLKAGRNMVTNGPLVSLTVDERTPGDTLKLEKPSRLRVVATGIGRHDFQKLELVQNGRVIQSASARQTTNAFETRLERDLPVDGPGWLAVRIDSNDNNELGKQLFAHSSPVYVEMAGQRICDVESGRALLKQMEESRADIRARGQFTSAAARDRLLALYEEAIRDLTERIAVRVK
jgi:hypothetical protein